jgi:hypothetical protein
MIGAAPFVELKRMDEPMRPRTPEELKELLDQYPEYRTEEENDDYMSYVNDLMFDAPGG